MNYRFIPILSKIIFLTPNNYLAREHPINVIWSACKTRLLIIQKMEITTVLLHSLPTIWQTVSQMLSAKPAGIRFPILQTHLPKKPRNGLSITIHCSAVWHHIFPLLKTIVYAINTIFKLLPLIPMCRKSILILPTSTAKNIGNLSLHMNIFTLGCFIGNAVKDAIPIYGILPAIL